MNTATGNTNAMLPALALVDAGWTGDYPGHHLTSWAATSSVAMGNPTVTYHAGDVVTYGSNPDLYRGTMDTSAGPPPMHPEAWTRLPVPADDVRVAPGSAYAGLGVR